jgi:putative hydrolase of the HAD superfamily
VPTQLILFDLGGVLASLGRPAEQMQLDIADDQFWSVWLSSPTVAAFETGGIGEAEFVERFPGEIGLPDTGREFGERFLDWRLQLYPGVLEMLRKLGESHRIALLSNTNPIHWNMVDAAGDLRPLFDHVFLSYEIGCAKPGNAIFEHVLQAVPDRPGDIVFLDDTLKNVEAAGSFGINALHTSGPDGISLALESAQ